MTDFPINQINNGFKLMTFLLFYNICTWQLSFINWNPISQLSRKYSWQLTHARIDDNQFSTTSVILHTKQALLNKYPFLQNSQIYKQRLCLYKIYGHSSIMSSHLEQLTSSIIVWIDYWCFNKYFKVKYIHSFKKLTISNNLE